MRVAFVNLITKTADLPKVALPTNLTGSLSPPSDQDLNVVEMSRSIVALGHEVDLYISDAFLPQRRWTPDPGMRIEYIPTRLKRAFPPTLAPLTPSLSRIVRQGGYDAVITTELFQVATLLTWLAAKGASTRTFVWQELDILMRGPAGYAQHLFYRSLGRKVARDLSLIVPRSRSARRHLLSEGIPEESIGRTVVHSGVDTDLFRPLDRDSSRRHHGLEDAESVILCLGRLHVNKGMDIMVRAMPALLKERPGTVLMIKGVGPQEVELKALAASLGLGSSVRFLTGHVSKEEMPSLFNSADLLAVTSRIDLFPFTSIESISCGVPVATSFERGLRTDLVEEGAAALLPADEQRLPGALSTLLADTARLRSMGRRGRELAEADFDFQVGAHRFARIFTGEIT